MRIIVLVLAVLMMTGAAGQAVEASPEVASLIDDAPNQDPPILPVQVMVPLLDLQAPIRTCAPRSRSRGRMHAVFVFRPPRLIASR